jgi:hypothetical protein
MEYVREQRERIREVKMLQVLKRSLALDARSKIKPYSKNPSLLRMSELRTGAGLSEDLEKSAKLFSEAQTQRQIEFNKSLEETIAKVNASVAK